MTGQPVYEHDCDPEHGCHFLGTMPAPGTTGRGKDVLDLWVHLGPGNEGSAIFRWDDEGSEYESLPLGAVREHYASDDRHPVFAEILRRVSAVEKAAEVLRSLERTHGPDLDVMGIDSDVAAAALAAAGLLPSGPRETRTEYAINWTCDEGKTYHLDGFQSREHIDQWAERMGPTVRSWRITATREVGTWVEVPSRAFGEDDEDPSTSS